MRKTFAIVAAALASLAAAAVAALLRPILKPVEPQPQSQRAGALRMTTQLDHRYLSEVGGGERGKRSGDDGECFAHARFNARRGGRIYFGDTLTGTP